MSRIKLFLFLTLFTALLHDSTQQTTFCSSYCSNSVTACTDITKANCTICASSIYLSAPDASIPADPCRLKNMHTYIATQLQVSTMNISSFITSYNTIQTCATIYKLSGKYVDYDYIAKNYTSIPINHYEIVIRFSVGYIGTWNTTDNLNLYVQHSYGAFNNPWSYSCGATQLLCSTPGAGLDCFQTKQYTVSHNNSYLFLNFSALYIQSDPLVRFWGIKDLVIVSRDCHITCKTCSGPLSTQCTSCQSGYYLNGNICAASCPTLYIPSLNLCTVTCPMEYFKNSLNTDCEPCMVGCLYCTSLTKCILWKDSNANPDNTWQNYLGIWVALIVFGCVCIIIGIWKLCQSSRSARKTGIRKNNGHEISQQFTNINQDQVTDEKIKQMYQGLDNGNRGTLTGKKRHATSRTHKQIIESFGKY